MRKIFLLLKHLEQIVVLLGQANFEGELNSYNQGVARFPVVRGEFI